MQVDWHYVRRATIGLCSAALRSEILTPILLQYVDIIQRGDIVNGAADLRVIFRQSSVGSAQRTQGATNDSQVSSENELDEGTRGSHRLRLQSRYARRG